MPTTSASIEEIRSTLPAVQGRSYLNAGTYGPMPRAAYEAMTTRIAREYELGRLRRSDSRELAEARGQLRAAFGRIFNCSAEEVALTHGTTDGINAALWGLDWEPGDEIVTTRMEHFGGVMSAYTLAERRGVRVRFAASEAWASEDIVETIRAEMSDRTKAVICSHVSWMSGAVLPIGEIAAVAREFGAVLIVDGAQSLGAVPVDVKRDGIDVYAGPAQKWLGGPGGLGALYVSNDLDGRLKPAYGAHAAFTTVDEFGNYEWARTAARQESVSLHGPSVFSALEAVRWLLDDVGLDLVYERTPVMADVVRSRLAEVDGVEVTTPVGTKSGLTHFTFEGWEPQAVVEELTERSVHIRSLKSPSGLRVSAGFYTIDEDVDRLVNALRVIRDIPPHPPAEPAGM